MDVVQIMVMIMAGVLPPLHLRCVIIIYSDTTILYFPIGFSNSFVAGRISRNH